MRERERILELVKQGILSTEEALVLLENIATEKDESLVDLEAEKVKKPSTLDEKQEHSSTIDKIEQTSHEDFKKELEEDERRAFEKFEENEARDKERLEQILEELATKANQASAQLDELNVTIQKVKTDIRDTEEQIMVLDTMEDLETLSEEKEQEREALTERMSDLQSNLSELESEKAILEDQLKDIRKQQKESAKDEWMYKFEIPEDWKETANETFSQVGEKMSEAGNQLGSFLKKTIDAVTTTVNDNVDWKDVNIKVPGVASQSFSHEFVYPDNSATIVDIKVANGEVKLKQWDRPDVKVEAAIKLYGKMDAATPFEAFLERSDLDVTDEKISFQIPNKRVKADLVFYLPARVYDHVSIKLLNGAVKITEFDVKDIFTKSTNGDMTFDKLSATMLEVEGVNGTVKVKDSHVIDLLGESVNGEFVIQSDVENMSISLINGDIKVTAHKANLAKLNATTVNGQIKVALPADASFDVTAKTNLGSVKNRFSHAETVKEKKSRNSHMIQMRRSAGEQTAYLILNTTTGNVYLKDTDK
ncbi:daptomycin-sensing surface protein LiaX [Vagococcus acidifermentans]|uniref:Uncharacterized protein n=1 Tax=Vagococcus acidifermentans TaxID=564710 RepID=A0A430ATR0_9ENTE|nr:daptomycin-sensing surface protein LiaX [Vagococcus acidifermentans]RSU11440.1 hypothetical protein CBF27_08045 [Vagococcus acidifermentans]